MQAIIETLTNQPSPLNRALHEMLVKKGFEGFFTAEEVQTLCTQTALNRLDLAFALLPLAASFAHTAISHFKVGAVAIGRSGNFYLGANQEFAHAAIAQTIHAEQSALSHAWLRNERQVTDIVVNYTPCGHCRQFMNELTQAEDLRIHLPHQRDNALHDYLPDAFGPKDLNVTAGLLSEEHQGLQTDSNDAVICQAVAAADLAHTAYSQSPHGIALAFADGRIVTGRYAENAAFNPSLPALQSALNFAYLNAFSLTELRRVVMAERATALSHRTQAEALLAPLCEVPLEYVAL